MFLFSFMGLDEHKTLCSYCFLEFPFLFHLVYFNQGSLHHWLSLYKLLWVKQWQHIFWPTPLGIVGFPVTLQQIFFFSTSSQWTCRLRVLLDGTLPFHWVMYGGGNRMSPAHCSLLVPQIPSELVGSDVCKLGGSAWFAAPQNTTSAETDGSVCSMCQLWSHHLLYADLLFATTMMTLVHPMITGKYWCILTVELKQLIFIALRNNK